MHRVLWWTALFSIILHPGIGWPQGGELSQRIAELSDKLASATEGQVLSLQGDTLYIDLGQKDGIVEGNRFELFRLGQPLMVGGRVAGYEEKMIGEVEILRVRKDVSIAKVISKEEEIQKGDKVYQLMKKVRRVAVTEFLYGEGLNDFTRNLQDLFYTNLIQRGMSVVEREKLEQVLREQKIAYSGMIDLGTAAQVGKLLGVEGILVGSVADVGSVVAITARLVDVEKGTAITAARVELAKTADVIALLGRGSRSIGGRAGAVGEAPPVAKPQEEAKVEVQSAPKTPSVSKPTKADQRLTKSLRVTAAALTKRATEGKFAGYGGGDEAAKSLIAEYNLLVRKAKTLFKTDPFVETLEETGETGYPDANAAKVARLANELDIYLTSFMASQALKETAAALVKRAAQGHFAGYGGGDEAAKSLIAEYNLLVKKAKVLLKSDPFIQTLEETRGTGYADVDAAKVGGLAKELETALASLSE